MEINYAIGIDPGTRATGIALLSNNNIDDYELIRGKSNDWKENSRNIVNEIHHFVKRHWAVEDIVLEIPEHWGGDAKGFAARESGAILKLSMFAGIVYGSLLFLNKTVTLCSPSKWKGQLPKVVVANRLHKIYDFPKDLNHNIVDAIGIAHSYMNKWKI